MSFISMAPFYTELVYHLSFISLQDWEVQGGERRVIIEVDLYSQIRTLHTEGESQRYIARCLGIPRQTVKKYYEGNTHPDVLKSYTRTRLYGASNNKHVS